MCRGPGNGAELRLRAGAHRKGQSPAPGSGARRPSGDRSFGPQRSARRSRETKICQGRRPLARPRRAPLDRDAPPRTGPNTTKAPGARAPTGTFAIWRPERGLRPARTTRRSARRNMSPAPTTNRSDTPDRPIMKLGGGDTPATLFGANRRPTGRCRLPRVLEKRSGRSGSDRPHTSRFYGSRSGAAWRFGAPDILEPNREWGAGPRAAELWGVSLPGRSRPPLRGVAPARTSSQGKADRQIWRARISGATQPRHGAPGLLE